MRMGVLGTGMVGHAIASKLVAIGHEVMMGSREAGHPKAAAWAAGAAPLGRAGTFGDVATFGDMVFNCTRGASSLDALRAAGEDNLAGKILVDVANLLPPDPSSRESLGERIQQAFPRAKVVGLGIRCTDAGVNHAFAERRNRSPWRSAMTQRRSPCMEGDCRWPATIHETLATSAANR